MNAHDQRLWLKIDKIYKLVAHLKWSYVGTEDREIIEDMMKYLKVLKERLEKNE